MTNKAFVKRVYLDELHTCKHRDGGYPAVLREDGTCEWWVRGVFYGESVRSQDGELIVVKELGVPWSYPFFPDPELTE